ncbi:MAG: CHAD domain-containing protein [Hyphomonas sp.]|uniref:CHAD domain-containing protein n=1 Tax=Hyphomonas sp. TaxID=87 RepID=UPI0017A3D38C|nr:CHAD domain-containing protein [Hyphomonas sp.]MBA3067395.1 CHAD domain-containing protein [Hyphomonas sp.]MBU3921422.1 CHAD domain-containing protein [Alphaproteobacteria bacterium]MBU4061054.1 CHAD domain-containing protein [Alphaproteobacteria bacterium]MBU4165910.1 CHAD domain-containing protein [Alphaproteobacteria bacterium]
MGYRFKAGEKSMTEGLRRVAADEFALIRQRLADKSLPLPRKVHEGRKATKRLRALIRLVAPVLPDAHDDIAALRAAAGQLSALRDTGALAETLGRLALPDTAAASLTEALATKPAGGVMAQRRLITAFGAEMEAAALRAEGWTLDREGWDALAPGLERTQRRFRKALDGARRAEDQDPVHVFRKRAKDHWYHTLLLRRVFPEVMSGYAAAGEQLCDDLGDWRDLGLLEAAVHGLPAHALSKADAGTALDAITKARRRALRRAFRIAGRLASETPDAYAQRLKDWWKAAR